MMGVQHNAPARTRIKFCGMTSLADAEAAAEAGADAIGLIFVEGTPRYIDPDAAAQIMAALPPLVTAVGVTRDLTVEQFADLEQRCPCVLMQLHGRETDKTVRACGPGVIKAFRFDRGTINTQLARFGAIEEVDAVLIDGGDGGTGEAADFEAVADALAEARGTGFAKPVFLAGGLTPDNVAEAVRTVRPWAVDVSSGVEVPGKPGVKDHDKLRAFADAVRSA